MLRFLAPSAAPGALVILAPDKGIFLANSQQNYDNFQHQVGDICRYTYSSDRSRVRFRNPPHKCFLIKIKRLYNHSGKKETGLNLTTLHIGTAYGSWGLCTASSCHTVHMLPPDGRTHLLRSMANKHHAKSSLVTWLLINEWTSDCCLFFARRTHGIYNDSKKKLPSFAWGFWLWKVPQKLRSSLPPQQSATHRCHNVLLGETHWNQQSSDSHASS